MNRHRFAVLFALTLAAIFVSRGRWLLWQRKRLRVRDDCTDAAGGCLIRCLHQRWRHDDHRAELRVQPEHADGQGRRHGDVYEQRLGRSQRQNRRPGTRRSEPRRVQDLEGNEGRQLPVQLCHPPVHDGSDHGPVAVPPRTSSRRLGVGSSPEGGGNCEDPKHYEDRARDPRDELLRKRLAHDHADDDREAVGYHHADRRPEPHSPEGLLRGQ